jgi:hypothetical protein
VSPKGYITRDLFTEVLEDMHNFIVDNKIPTPVILFLDGAGPHISIDAADFCISHGIQPFLLRPNMTHLLQVSYIIFIPYKPLVFKNRNMSSLLNSIILFKKIYTWQIIVKSFSEFTIAKQ